MGARRGCRLPRRPSPTPHPNLSRPYGNEICIYIIKQFTYSVSTHHHTFHGVPLPEPVFHPPVVRLDEAQGCNYWPSAITTPLQFLIPTYHLLPLNLKPHSHYA